jgi:hypothetical protein
VNHLLRRLDPGSAVDSLVAHVLDRRTGSTSPGHAVANAAEALRDWVEATEEGGEVVPAPGALEDLRRDPDVAEALAAGASLAVVPLVRETGKPVKANLSIDAGVLAAIDEEAARRKLTRSALVELMARRMLAEMT